MKVVRVILYIVFAFILVSMVIFGYYGGFKKIRFEQEPAGGETLVYMEAKGDYAGSGNIMDMVFYGLKDRYGIEATRGFGIYYDNPVTTEPDQRRYEAGCVVEGLDSAQKAALEAEFKVRELPVQDCVVGAFPLKGKPSVIMGVIRVYPAMENYMKKNELIERFGPVMEIYDYRARKIFYRVMLLPDPADEL